LDEWKLVARYFSPGSFTTLEEDRTELHDLAGSETVRVKELAELYDVWAERCKVVPLMLPKARLVKPANFK
jgi:arylsulfatase